MSMNLKTITLVVVADDQYREIGATIEAIAATVVGVPFEVLIAANGFAVDQKVMENRPFRATFMSTERLVARALFLNDVLAHAKGDIVTLFPAGIVPERWWFRGVFELLERSEVVAVAPRLLNRSGERVVAAGTIFDGSAFARRCENFERDAIPVLEPAALVTAPFDGLSIRREALQRLGAFDPAYSRTMWDFDWEMRIHAQQLAIVYRPDVSMRVDIPPATGRGSAEIDDVNRFTERWMRVLAPNSHTEHVGS